VSRRKRILLKVVLAVAGTFVATTLAFSVWVEHVAIAREPVLASPPSILREELRQEPGGVSRLGRGWLRVHRGVRFLHLAGAPFDLGYENAKLTGDATEHLEDVLYRSLDANVPSRVAQRVLRKYLLFRQRHYPDFIPEARKLEILGLARGAARDRHPEDGPLFHRILTYHACHDLAHMLIDSASPFIVGHYDELRVGCTGFAAGSEATVDGHVLLARNFDFEAGRVFDDEKVVAFVEADGGIPFVSVAWAGMAGAVTGLNREGIACALNASVSDDDAPVGIPVSLVVRDVLERARTLDEAIAIVRAAPVFVSDNYLLASGREGRAVVVEKSPRRCAVREAGKGLVLAANHFLAPEFLRDRANAAKRSDATTEERFARLTELLTPLQGKLDPAAAVSILRDRRGPGGKDVGLGNRGAIDALIATHSVVIDASARVLWVSAGPHTLGRYLRVDLDLVLAKGAVDPDALDAGSFPEDPLLANGLADHVTLRKKLIEAQDALAAGDLGRAEARAREAAALDPRFFEPEEILARVALRQGSRAQATEHARAALERSPPFAALRAELEAIARPVP
jgi:hypothetical protein